jgi:hypothetical protein
LIDDVQDVHLDDIERRAVCQFVREPIAGPDRARGHIQRSFAFVTQNSVKEPEQSLSVSEHVAALRRYAQNKRAFRALVQRFSLARRQPRREIGECRRAAVRGHEQTAPRV